MTPCLAGSLEEGSISIAKQVLNVKLKYWISCGPCAVQTDTYRFRYQNGQWPLIGVELNEFSRNTHTKTQHSYNFLTGQAVHRQVPNQDGGRHNVRAKPKERRSKMTNPNLSLTMNDFSQRFASRQSQQSESISASPTFGAGIY